MGKSLFDMLDIVDTDEVLVDEFVSVCLLAKTLTRPLDLQSFIQQNRRTDRWLRRGLINIEHLLDKLAEKIDKSVQNSQSVLRNNTRQLSMLQGSRSTGNIASPGSHSEPRSSSIAVRSGRGSFVRGWLGGT